MSGKSVCWSGLFVDGLESTGLSNSGVGTDPCSLVSVVVMSIVSEHIERVRTLLISTLNWKHCSSHQAQLHSFDILFLCTFMNMDRGHFNAAVKF